MELIKYIFPPRESFMTVPFSTTSELFHQNEQGDYTLVVEVPGFTPDQLKVEVDGGLLKIKGHSDLGFSMRSIDRTYTLPRKAGTEEVVSSLENGILTLTFPRVETSKVIPILNPPT